MAALCRYRFGAAIGVTAALALTAPTAASADCANADARPGTASPRALANATVCLVNQERRRRGLRGLHANGRLARAAHAHSVDMVSRRYFSHVSLDGLRPIDRIRAAGYLIRARRWAAAENLAWGTARSGSPRAVVAGWLRRPVHRRNMLGRGYREIGIGAVAGAVAATYTANFGYRR